MRFFALLAVLLCFASCAARKESFPWQEINTLHTGSPPSLVGRWKSDTAPTGYWIIDRHADGRYASKFYLGYDRSKPHEIALEWGRWELVGKRYRHVIDGTNSDVLRRFIGRWREWPVIRQTHDRFYFEVNDGERYEQRISITASLPRLKLPVPKSSPQGWMSSRQPISIPPLSHIPDWVRTPPR